MGSCWGSVRQGGVWALWLGMFLLPPAARAIDDVPQGQTLWLRGSNADGHVNVATSGFRVAGVLRLESVQNTWTSGVTITNGTLTILPTGLLEVNPGSGGLRLVAGPFANLGTVRAEMDLTFDAAGAVYANAGSFLIAPRRSVVMHGRSQLFSQDAGELVIGGALDIQDAAFRFRGGNIHSNPVTLVNASLELLPGAAAGTGGFVFLGARGVHAGSVGPAQTIWVRGSNRGQHTLVTAAAGFANAGILRLDSVENNWSAGLTVNEGVLTNLAGGLIAIDAGAGGGRALTARVLNLGTVRADFDLVLVTPGGTFDNRGAVAVAEARTLVLRELGQVFVQRAGTLDVRGGFEVQRADFVYRAGAITGNPVLLADGALDTSGAAADPAAFTFIGSGNRHEGDLQATHTVWVRGSNRGLHARVISTNGFTTAGTLRLESTENSWTSEFTVLGGRLTNAPGGVLVSGVGAGGPRVLTASVLNRGELRVDQDLALVTPQGTFENRGAVSVAPSRTLSLQGAGQTFVQRSGSLVVQGAMDVVQAAFVYRGGTLSGNPVLVADGFLDTTDAQADPAAFTVIGGNNRHQGDLQPGHVLWVRGSNRGQHAGLTSSNGFANAGSIRLESTDNSWGSALTIRGGRLTNAPSGLLVSGVGAGGGRALTASVLNRGTLRADFDLALVTPDGAFENEGRVVVAPGRTLSLQGVGQVFVQRSGSLEIQGAMDVVQAALIYRGGPLTANPVVLVDGFLDTTGSRADTAAFTAIGGNNRHQGDLQSGHTLWIRGSNRGQHALLTSSNGFATAGIIRLESTDNNWSSSLRVLTGRLTNAPGGVIVSGVGAGGPRQLTASVLNRGLLRLDYDLGLATPDGAFENAGDIVVTAGRTLSMRGAEQVFVQREGTLALAGALDLQQATLVYRGGEISGNPVMLVDSLLDTVGASADPAAFTMVGGNNRLRGNLRAGQTLWVRGSNRGLHAQLTASDGFSNGGTLRLESTDNSWSSTLKVESGWLTNEVSGRIETAVGAGGPKQFNTHLLNRGTVVIGDTTSFIRADGAWLNAGWLRLAGVLTVSGSYTQDPGGTLEFALGNSLPGPGQEPVRIESHARLGGRLEVALVGTVPPAVNSRVALLSAKSVSGQFADISLPPGLEGVVEVGTNRVTLVVTAVGVTNAPPVVCVPPPPGLLAWWPAEGAADDLIGGHHGRFLDAQELARRYATGKVGRAFLLDGTGDSVMVPDDPRLTPRGGLTVEAWVAPATTRGDRMIAVHADAAIGQQSWEFGLGDGGVLRFRVYERGGATPVFRGIEARGTVIPTNAWTHVAGTFDPRSQDMALFVNGREITAGLTAGSAVVSSIADANSPLRIGALVNAAGLRVGHFAGGIDELALFTRALNASEIAAIHAAGAAGRCVDAPYLVVTEPASPLALGAAVFLPLRAALGTPPYTFSVDPASLPPGVGIVQSTGGASLSGKLGGAGSFRVPVVVTDSRGGRAQRVLAIEVVAQAPVLGRTPLADLTVLAGARALFKANVVDAGSVSYQWFFNEAPIPGANGSEYVIPAAAANDEGIYHYSASNAAGSVTSRRARLRVLVPPALTLQPRGQEVALGGSVTLTVEAAGTGPFSYQWRRNGTRLPGATGASLTLDNFQRADSGIYSVVVASPLGSVISLGAIVRVAVPELGFADEFAARGRIVTSDGAGRGSTVGASRAAGEPLHAGKRGGRSVWITWVAPLGGVATLTTRGSQIDTLLAVYTGSAVNALTRVAADEDSGGFFASSVRFNAVAGQSYEIAVDALAAAEGEFILDWAIDPRPDLLPALLEQPASQSVLEGLPVTFSVLASNPPPAAVGLEYRWFHNRAVIDGATGPTLTLSSVTTADLGVYAVEVSKGPLSIRSEPALLQFSLTDAGVPEADLAAEDKFSDAALPLQGASPSALRLFGMDGKPAGGLASGYSGTQVFSTSGSSTETGEPDHCGVIGGASQWFTYRAEATGDLVVTTDGSDFDTVLAVYAGSGEDFASLVLLGCDNDGGADGRDSLLRVPVVAGTDYFVAVDGVLGAAGVVRLSYQLEAPARFVSMAPQTDRWTLRLATQPGAAYTLEESTDLTGWTIIQQTNAASSVVDFQVPAASGSGFRFYRARSE